jgi:hypothetical protein
VGASVIFDAILAGIPCIILKKVRLESHKRHALRVVFSANILGSMAWYEFFPIPARYAVIRNHWSANIVSLVGIYGIWSDRNSEAAVDVTWVCSPFVIINDFEILMYAIGASATGSFTFHYSAAVSLGIKNPR